MMSAARRMVVVDDEPAVGRLIQSVAQGCGYDVTCTSDAARFRDAFAAIDPDAIVLDLSMPDVDGIELLRFLASAGCRAAILIISGFDSRVLDTAARLGAAMGLSIAGTLVKPMRVAEIRAAILALEMEPVR